MTTNYTGTFIKECSVNNDSATGPLDFNLQQQSITGIILYVMALFYKIGNFLYICIR